LYRRRRGTIKVAVVKKWCALKPVVECFRLRGQVDAMSCVVDRETPTYWSPRPGNTTILILYTFLNHNLKRTVSTNKVIFVSRLVSRYFFQRFFIETKLSNMHLHTMPQAKNANRDFKEVPGSY